MDRPLDRPSSRALKGRLARKPTVPAVDSPLAWAMVVSAFFASAVVFGVMYSFGVFLLPLAADFRASTAGVSALFSMTTIVYYFLGAPAGRLADRYGPHAVIATGAIGIGAGLCLTASANSLWLVYLTYSIGAGLGGACCYVPTLAVVGGWFVRHRNIALGIAAAGAGSGTLAFPPVVAALIERYGWRATFVTLGVVGGTILLACAAVTRSPPVQPAGERTGPKVSANLCSRPFILLYLSWVLATTALFVPFVFLPAFAREHGASEIAAASLISVIGGTSILGRLFLGPLGNRVGVLTLFKLTVLLMGLSYAIWLLPTYWALVAFAAVLGTSYGSRIAALPAVLIELFGTAHLGTMLGVFLTAGGLAGLIGPTLAGLAVELSGGYTGAIAFALAMGLLGFAVIAPLGRD